MQLPENVRRAIEERTSAVEFRALRIAAQDLSEAYRKGFPPRLDNPAHVAAYLATRMPATYAAATAVLREVRTRLGDELVESVLDAGAGTGASALAAEQWLRPKTLTLVDRDGCMADAAREFLPQAGIRIMDFERNAALPPHSIVIAAYSLGENAGVRVLTRLWEAALLCLVIIEPGTPRGFATIRQVRTELLSAGAHLLAPCPAAGPCPMIDPDWCHFGARVERTSLHRRLKGAELSYEDEKFSYVAFARKPFPRTVARIVARPLYQPGLAVLETCTPQGLETARVTKSDREAFRAARSAVWGGEFLLNVTKNRGS